jgi:hypothetical protein
MDFAASLDGVFDVFCHFVGRRAIDKWTLRHAFIKPASHLQSSNFGHKKLGELFDHPLLYEDSVRTMGCKILDMSRTPIIKHL